MTVATQLYARRSELKQEIYEITGISDIVRGQSNANETLGAQQIKSQFAGQRIGEKQQDVERFVRELFQIKAEIIGEHFTPEILSMMTGIPATDEVMQILKSDILRAYVVDIESNSTIQTDNSKDKQDHTEFLKAFNEIIDTLIPLVQTKMLSIDAAKQILLFGLKPFKGSRQVEEALETFGQELAMQAAMPPGAPGMPAPPLPPGAAPPMIAPQPQGGM